jgi:DNA repair exonuclease SbcCD ATPase subunit
VVRSLSELREGAPVVHVDHGVGRYRGLETMRLGEADSEFLTLEYADGARLYVPVANLHLISRYTGADEAAAPLHRLGSEQWEKAKRKAAEKVRDAAADLHAAKQFADFAAARRRLDAAGRERDRFALLANVLRRADRAFRLKHQPDVVKQAGRYLRTITGGRYHRLSMEGEAPGLQVYRSNGAEHTDLDTPEATPQAVAAPLSEGLRDQVYVALRLALLDHLDRGQEALPVLLDEVFTTWDRGRRKKAYMVLEELAERRQVFVFTCHPALSEEMSRRLDAHRLLLEAPRDDVSRSERDEKEKAASARA